MAYDGIEERVHQPVLLEETIKFLAPGRGGDFLDCTFGQGGHTEAIVDQVAGGGRVVGIDLDPYLIASGRERFAHLKNLILQQGNYTQAGKILESCGISKVDGILLDLGFSSFHIEASCRGFSFQRGETLDMRYDPLGGGLSAGAVVNEYSKKKTEEILRAYGEEKWAGRVASAIVEERKRGPITTGEQLRGVIVSAKGKFRGRDKVDPATKTFQALRIFVNRELENVEEFMKNLPSLLKEGGRVAVISYHSLEDRIVKRYFKIYSGRCVCPAEYPACVCGCAKIMKILTPRPLRPGMEEVRENRRSRSARLRVAQMGG